MLEYSAALAQRRRAFLDGSAWLAVGEATNALDPSLPLPGWAEPDDIWDETIRCQSLRAG